MKRIGVLSLSMIFIFTSAITSVSANDETANHLEGVQINYETQLGHENRTKEDIVEELVKNGLSIEEAEYYAKIDILTNQLEKNDITVDFSDVEDYSNAYVKANHEELANEALDNLDKKALKAILSKNESLNAGIDDLQQVQEFINQQNKREQNTNANHIIKLKYDDGSELIFEGSTTKDNEISDSVIPQTELSGPWSRSVNFGNTINDRDDNGGSYTSRATWRYKSGSSYASVSDVLKWKFGGKSDTTIDFVSDSGASSYAGVVKVDKEYRSNYQRGWARDWHVVQGYTDIMFEVSGSFSAGFEGLSISINAGNGWHQYAIVEAVRMPSKTMGAYGVYYSAGHYY